MKKLVLAIALLTSTGMTGFAQKFGHIDSNELMLLMPERKTAEAQVQALTLELQNTLEAMTTEYQGKVAEYQKSEATLSNSVKELKAREIGELEQRIQAFQVRAQEDLKAKENELLSPMIEKARKSIEAVGRENGYTYIFDISSGATVYEGGENVLPLVKKKMGLAD
ncbi:MAG: outer membrane protein [Flavobacteriales bacterium]|jgi:outer membrane protein